MSYSKKKESFTSVNLTAINTISSSFSVNCDKKPSLITVSVNDLQKTKKDSIQSLIAKIVYFLLGLTLLSALGLIVLLVVIVLSISKQPEMESAPEVKFVPLISPTIIALVFGLLCEMLFNYVAVTCLLALSNKLKVNKKL